MHQRPASDKIVKNSYRVLYLLMGVTGLLILFGVPEGHFHISSLVYYTVQSNILCIIYFSLRLYYDNRPKKKETSFGKFILSIHTKYYVTMAILLTFLIYHFLLAPAIGNGPNRLVPRPVSNYILHYIIPLMTFIDFLVFDKKGGRTSWTDPFKWLVIPFVYFAFILIRAPFFGNIGTTNSPYPYCFIDFTVQPPATVWTNIMIITVLFIILGYVVVGINRLRTKR